MGRDRIILQSLKCDHPHIRADNVEKLAVLVSDGLRDLRSRYVDVIYIKFSHHDIEAEILNLLHEFRKSRPVQRRCSAQMALNTQRGDRYTSFLQTSHKSQ